MANTILNGSFEFDTDFDGLPDSWTLENANVSTTAQRDDPLTVAHGSQSLRLSNTATLGSGVTTGILQESVALAAAIGQPFAYSFYVYPTALNSGAVEITLEHHNAAHTVLLTTTATLLVAQIPLNTLTRVTVTGTIPASAHHASARIRLKGQGAGQTAGQIVVFVDGAQYEAGSIATAFTPASADALDVYRNGQYLLNGIVMNETRAADGIIVEGCEGLFDLPGVKVSGDYEDDANHGGVAGQERFTRRVVTMDLAVHGSTEEAFHARLQALRTAMIPDSSDKLFWFKRVGIGGTDKKFAYARVRKFGGFKSTYEMASSFFSGGALELLLADPALYDYVPAVRTDTLTTPTTSSAFAITPAGNFRTYPVIRITGPATNPGINQQVTINGVVRNRTIRLATTVPTGQYVDIDVKKRTVIHSSGADWRQYLDDSNQWWQLEAGIVNTIALVANPNPTTWTSRLTYYPAWV